MSADPASGCSVRRRRVIWRLPAMLTGVLVAQAALAQIARPDLDVLLYTSFDATVKPHVGASIEVAGGEGLEYVEGHSGQAARFGEGDFVEYRNLPPIDPQSGTIELWVTPHFPNSDLADHYYLRLENEDASSWLDLNFSTAACGPRVAIGVGGETYQARADFRSYEERPNHLAVTWDTIDPDIARLRLFVDGVIAAYAEFEPMAAPTVLRIGRKSATEATDADADLDELYVYNRALTEMQVWALHESTEGPEARVAAIREMVARDDALRAERMRVLREERRVAMVVGRTVSGWPDSLFRDLGMDVPPRIEETALETTDLSAYDLLIFPGGGGFVLSDAGAEALRQYVQAGGGYFGICAGAHAAQRYGLTENEHFPFRERGRCEVSLRPHPITEGFHPRRLLDVRHANGPFIAVTDPAEAPVLYKAGPPYACIIARQLGEGRVVSCSAHPESDAESRPLTRNAILWAAKVTGLE